MNRIAFRLCLVTDRHQTAGRPLHDVVDAGLNGGVEALQVREKDLSARSLLDLARSMRQLTVKAGATLLINDRVDICRAVGADGVHLRADHLPVRVVRRLLGDSRFIGVSVHSVAEAEAAEFDGADFVLLGPVYETPSKRVFSHPLGVRAIEEAATRVSIPIFAIGGVTLDRVAEIMDAGAWGVAVISAILLASHPREAAVALRRRLTEVSAGDTMNSG